MKRARLIRHLQARGCRIQREGGRHTVYANESGTRKSAVPRHREIKPGTVRAICADPGVPPPREK